MKINTQTSYIIGGIIVILFICFIALGYLNSYIGYYGYNKDKVRRFSDTKEESIKRGVFIKELPYKLKPNDTTIIIRSVFIERGYKWGSSDEETVLLSANDTYENNNSKLPYQIVVSASEKKGKKILTKPLNSDKYYNPIKNIYFKDTVLFEGIVEPYPTQRFEIYIWQDKIPQ